MIEWNHRKYATCKASIGLALRPRLHRSQKLISNQKMAWRIRTKKGKYTKNRLVSRWFFSPIISLKRNGSPAVNEVEFWTLSAWFLRGWLDFRQYFHEPQKNWASLGEYCFPISPSHYLSPLFPLFPPTSSFGWFFSLLHPVGCRCR